MIHKKILWILLLSLALFIPTVIANSPPELYDSSAPFVAVPGSNVVYRITYKDKDGDAPEYVKIYFPNIGAKDMRKISGDYNSGAVYEYVWEGQKYSYDYRFEASDGKDIAKNPWYGGTWAPVNFVENLENNKIYLFSQKSNKPIWSYDTGEDWVTTVAISDDGNYIVAQAGDYAYLFSKESPKPIWKYNCNFNTDTGGPILVDISADGEHIVVGCSNSINLFLRKNKELLWSYKDESTTFYSVAISYDGSYLAAGASGTDELIFFSKESNRPLWRYKATANIHGLSLSSDGKYIAAGSHSPEEKAYIFSKESNVPLVGYKTSLDSPAWVAAISGEGKYAVYGLDGSDRELNSIFLFSYDGSLPLRKWSTGGLWVRSVDITFDGKYILAGSANQKVYLFDRDKDEPLWEFKTNGKVGYVSISKDGNFIVAGSKDKNIYLFSKESDEPLWDYTTASWVTTLAISYDGNYIVAGTGISQYISEPHTSVCGNNLCERENGESEENCQEDCLEAIEGKETIKVVCGDTICEREKGETYENCPRDCIPPGKEGISEKHIEKTERIRGKIICGNNICEEPEENKDNCLEDCMVGFKEKEKKGIFQFIIDFFRGLFRK